LEFHPNINNILAKSASFLAKNTNEVEQIRTNATFSYFFGTSPPRYPFQNPVFSSPYIIPASQVFSKNATA